MAVLEKNHYEILGVTASSSKADIDRAYVARKTDGRLSSAALWSLERAYVTLSDPSQKRKYDSEQKKSTGEARRAERATRIPAIAPNIRGPFLTGAFALLGIILWLRVWPMVGWRFVTHAVGTDLVVGVTGEPLGTVLEYESDHRFANGAEARAYRIKLPGDGGERWLTRNEVNQLAWPAAR